MSFDLHVVAESGYRHQTVAGMDWKWKDELAAKAHSLDVGLAIEAQRSVRQ